MNYRETDILPEKTISSAGITTIGVDLSQVISRLNLTYRYTQVGYSMSAYPHKCVSKIELVDGSDVLFSLDGGQCQALNIYDRKVSTMSHGQHHPGLSEFQTYGIDFGRYLWDKELAFDPNAFTNPQLKVTINPDASDNAVTSGYLRLRASLFDEKVITPKGFLMSKNHYSYTPSASGVYEYIELPQDYLIKRMLIQPYKLGYESWYVCGEVKIDENNENKIPFDVELEDYIRRRKGVDQPIEELFVGEASGAAEFTFFITPTDYYANVVGETNGTQTISQATIGRGGRVYLTASGACQYMGIARGNVPNHCVNFPFGDQNDIDDWYDITNLSKVRVRLKSGDGYATSDISLILQQLRPY